VFPLDQIADVVAPRSEDPKVIRAISFELTLRAWRGKTQRSRMTDEWAWRENEECQQRALYD